MLKKFYRPVRRLSRFISKLAAGAYYDKQRVTLCSLCTYLQSFFYATRANSSEINTFRGYPSLTPACAGFLELRKSGLGVLQSTFNAKNFVRRLSRSIASHFGAIYS